MTDPIRPKNQEDMYDAMYQMQVDQRELLVVVGGHPDIDTDTGLCGLVNQQGEDIKGVKKDVAWAKNRIYWIMGVIASAGLLGGGGYGISQVV